MTHGQTFLQAFSDTLTGMRHNFLQALNEALPNKRHNFLKANHMILSFKDQATHRVRCVYFKQKTHLVTHLHTTV